MLPGKSKPDLVISSIALQKDVDIVIKTASEARTVSVAATKT